MKMKRCLLAVLLLLVFSLRGDVARAPQAVKAQDVSLADANLHYIGRWDKSDGHLYRSYWTGASLRTRFIGTEVAVKLAEGTTLAVSIDGEPLRGVNAGQGVTPLHSSPLAPGVHTLSVGGAGQNEEVAFQGLTLAPGGETRPAPARPLLEFVGDSISASVYGNYCILTGDALGADHVQIAFSARSLTSGYGCADEKTGLDAQYFRLKNFNHLGDNPPTPWNFSDQPQIVVVNLGQNDQCGGEPDATMTASYTRFLAAVRAKRPQAWLVALRPFGGPYADAIRQAVAARAAAGDKRVRFVDTTGWLDGADFRDGVHPNDGGNVKAARRLTPLLRPLLGLPTSPPAAVTVGDPKNPAALSRQILDAYVGGARRIVVRPGVYVLPDFGRTALRLDAWEDVTLSGFGATLILTDLAWMHDGMDLSRCRGVTVQGFRISQNQVTAYQGKIIGVGKNSDGKPYCDWRPDAGYPVPPNDEPKGFLGGDVNVADARTRRLKVGVGDFYGVKAARLPNGAFRALMGGPFGVGDRLVGRYGDAPFKVFLNDSRNCTLQDLTLTRNGFSPIREDNGGGNRVIHCVWKLGPKPPGATEEPLVTNAADGLHSTGANPGPDIENCVMEGVFLDDNFAIHGSLQTVKSAAGRVLTLDGGVGNLTVGQPIRLSDDKGFYADARVTALQENENKTTSVTLDKDLAVPAGAKASNPLRDGAGYKIIGCRLGRTRSRGILVKADNGQIKNNVIENCGMSAVSIGPEYYWNEADYAHHVLIENNTLRGNGQAGYGGAAIFIHGDGAMGNQNIIVRANTMVSNYQGDIDVQWTNGVTLTGNSFTGVSPNPADFKDCALLTLSNCRAIQLAKNVVSNADAYKAGLIVLGTNAADVQNNTPAGLRTLKARAMKSK